MLGCSKSLLCLILDASGTPLSTAPHCGNLGAVTVGTQGLIEQVTQQSVRLVQMTETEVQRECKLQYGVSPKLLSGKGVCLQHDFVA